jgi:hypothetical protein
LPSTGVGSLRMTILKTLSQSHMHTGDWYEVDSAM